MSKSTAELWRDQGAEVEGPSRLLIMADGPERNEIAELAYQLWVQRGCPEGSPDEDWRRAEAELLRRLS